MKNIERPEVQELIAKFIDEHNKIDYYPSLIAIGMPLEPKSTVEWFNSEYVKPHHWEPWELEAMRHIPKRILYLERRKDNKLPRALQADDCYTDYGMCTQINFPSLKNEKINIDDELERNGMHR